RKRVEFGRQDRADRVHRGNNGNGDAARDKSIFDGRGAGLILKKTQSDVSHHLLHLLWAKFACRSRSAQPMAEIRTYKVLPGAVRKANFIQFLSIDGAKARFFQIFAGASLA